MVSLPTAPFYTTPYNKVSLQPKPTISSCHVESLDRRVLSDLARFEVLLPFQLRSHELLIQALRFEGVSTASSETSCKIHRIAQNSLSSDAG